MKMYNYFMGVEIVSGQFSKNGKDVHYQLVNAGGMCKFTLSADTQLSDSECKKAMEEALDTRNSGYSEKGKLKIYKITYDSSVDSYTNFEACGYLIES